MSFPALPIIQDALHMIGMAGFGDAPKSEPAALAAREMDRIVQGWAGKSLYNPGVYQEVVTSTGATSLQLGGVGGDTPTSPKAILQVTTEYSSGNGPVYPCDRIGTVQDYFRIPVRNIAAITKSAFWDYQQGQSTLYLYPAPAAGMIIRIMGLPEIARITSAQGTVELPSDYEEFLLYTLALALVPHLPPDINTSPKVFEYLERRMNTAGSGIKRRNSNKVDMAVTSDYAPSSGRHGNSYLTWPGRFP